MHYIREPSSKFQNATEDQYRPDMDQIYYLGFGAWEVNRIYSAPLSIPTKGHSSTERLLSEFSV